jgi:quercetin dioxygenase-like cupin family protein
MTSAIEMRIIHRDELPDLRSVVVDGVEHGIGLLKDFSKHPEIAEFIPPTSRLAISWVHLDPGEVLETHAHPIESMVIVATGTGATMDGREIGAGDIILIPRGADHGYVGAGDGFWALAVQFEERGLYEDPDDPLVEFGETDLAEAPGREGLAPSTSFESLVARNAVLVEEYRRGRLYRLIDSDRLDDRGRRTTLLELLQVWSGHFQRALFVRSALSESEPFAGAFRRHLAEEFDHDRALADDRRAPTAALPWDAELEAFSAWFRSQVLAGDDLERTVLVHLVLEAASEAISEVGSSTFSDPAETSYFLNHRQLDGGHVAAGLELLQGVDPSTYQRLGTAQERGWAMISRLCDRIAELCDPRFT